MAPDSHTDLRNTAPNLKTDADSDSRKAAPERDTGLEGFEECGAGLGLGLINAKITELFSEAYNWDPFPMKVLAMLE